MADINVSGVRLTDEQVEWLDDWIAKWPYYGNPVPADAHKYQILKSVWDALPAEAS